MRVQKIRALTSIGVGVFLFFGQAVAGFENNKKYPIADYENFRRVNQTSLVIGYRPSFVEGVTFFIPTSISLANLYEQEARKPPRCVPGGEIKDGYRHWYEGVAEIFDKDILGMQYDDIHEWGTVCHNLRQDDPALSEECVHRTLNAFFIRQKREKQFQDAATAELNRRRLELEADDGMCDKWCIRPLLRWMLQDVRL